MKVGLETYDANGNLIFNSDEFLTFKYLGSQTVTSSGTKIVDVRLGDGTPFVIAIALDGITLWTENQIDAYGVISGNTITCYLINVGSATFIYGVY